MPPRTNPLLLVDCERQRLAHEDGATQYGFDISTSALGPDGAGYLYAGTGIVLFLVGISTKRRNAL
ncbi:MAG: hypothetical protein V4505_28105 [Pseudomonadota bacterium]